MHCPIDSVITDKILGLMHYYDIKDNENMVESISNNGSFGVSWNNINKEKYIQIQNLISNLCDRDNNPSKLFFDFLYWERRDKGN